MGLNLAIELNQGSGKFGPGQTYFAGFYPEGIAIADIKGDGINEVLVSSDDSGDIAVLMNDGTGKLTAPTFGYATGGWPWSIVAADFGRGKIDLAIPDDESTAMAYLKGRGDGTFVSGINYYANPSLAKESSSLWYDGYMVAAGDFNGTGMMGLALGMYPDWNFDPTVGVSLFMPSLTGSYAPVNVGSGGNMPYVAVADFNGDGKADIAASDQTNGVIQVFTGKGNGAFNVPVQYTPTNMSPTGLVAADLRGNGLKDLVVYDYNWDSSIGGITVFLNDGQGGFKTPVNCPLMYGGEFLAVADVNGDGIPDIVAVEYGDWDGDDNYVAVLLGDGAGGFTLQGEMDFQPTDPYSDTMYYPIGVALGDFNGDKKVDIALTYGDEDSYYNQYIVVMLNNGNWSSGNVGYDPTTAVAYPATLLDTYSSDSPSPSDIRAVDLNGDGKLDLVYTNYDYGTIGVLYGKGDGTFYDTVEYPVAADGYGLAIADLWSEGALSIAVASSDAPVVTVLRQVVNSFGGSADVSSLTVTAGGSGNVTITVSPGLAFSGTVTFSCPSPPPGVTCSFNPSTLTFPGNVYSTVLTVNTTGTNVAQLHPNVRRATGLWASFFGIGIVGCVLLGKGKKLSKRGKWMVAGMLVLLLFTFVGCWGGGGRTINTPTGSQNLNVQMQSGNIVKTIPVTLVVH